MKSIKMFGLATLAALIATAVVGASSALASSTVLCKVDENPCSTGDVVSHVHETSVGKMKLLSSPTVECNVLFLGDALGLASPLIIHGTFTYSNCNNSCEVIEENGPALIEVLKEGTELAKVIVRNFLLKTRCFFSITCSYDVEWLEGHGLGPLLVGSGNGQVTITGQEMHLENGGFCSPEAFLGITTTPLVATYISS